MFLSTPPSRVATTDAGTVCGDYQRFYPRHPRGWRRLQCGNTAQHEEFLSTPPSRVATNVRFITFVRFQRFYPRHPRGWRRLVVLDKDDNVIRFYPRHPRGWRRLWNIKCCCVFFVSIHATLAGGDETWIKASRIDVLFLSTPPSRVATGATLLQGKTYWLFLSTPPSRVATSRVTPSAAWAVCFYPRHPRGWRRGLSAGFRVGGCFYPRHPRGWRPRASAMRLSMA